MYNHKYYKKHIENILQKTYYKKHITKNMFHQQKYEQKHSYHLRPTDERLNHYIKQIDPILHSCDDMKTKYKKLFDIILAIPLRLFKDLTFCRTVLSAIYDLEDGNQDWVFPYANHLFGRFWRIPGLAQSYMNHRIAELEG